MATAERREREVEIVLTLTLAEAQTLRKVCLKVGGPPGNTPRGRIDQITRALDSVGVTAADEPVKQTLIFA